VVIVIAGAVAGDVARYKSACSDLPDPCYIGFGAGVAFASEPCIVTIAVTVQNANICCRWVARLNYWLQRGWNFSFCFRNCILYR